MRQTYQWRFTAVLLLAVVLALFLLVFARPIAGQGLSRQQPDSGNGHRLAEMVCVTCHLVSPDARTTAVVGVPSFPAIANHTGQTPEKLAAAIIIPHPPMPAIQLTNTEMRDIIAYILSLKTEK